MSNETVNASEIAVGIKASEVSTGLDAAKVMTTKVDLDSPRWEISPSEGSPTVEGISTTPLHLIMAADEVTQTQAKLDNQSRYLAAHMFNIAKECKDVYEFEAFMITLKHEANWKRYPDKVRNYKSRIITHFSNPEVPSPADTVKLPALNEKGKAKDKAILETREFKSMGEYYDYCKEAATPKPKANTPASPAPSTGVEVTPTATIIHDTAGHETVEKEADPFSMILGHLQTLYAQADVKERQRMVKRTKQLALDIEKSQEERFNKEEEAVA